MDRREFGLGVAALIATFNAACTETVYIDTRKNFRQNFNYYAYEPFDETDLKEANERDKQKISAAVCRAGLQKSVDEELSGKFLIDDLVRFYDQDGLVMAESRLKTPEGQAAVQQKYPFIKSIKPVQSPYYPDNYELDTDAGYIYISLNDTSLAIGDYGANRSISTTYNTGGPNPQTDFKRTVYINTRDSSKERYARTLTLDPGMGVLDDMDGVAQSYANSKGEKYEVRDSASFTRLLRDCNSSAVIGTFLKDVLAQNMKLQEKLGRETEVAETCFGMTDIRDVKELMEIFRLMPPDPEIHAAWVADSLRSHSYDKVAADEYRDPVTTLRSAWADCDDYAVINYFWAYLGSRSPHMLGMTNTRSGEHHALVWYRDAQERPVVLDNAKSTVMKSGEKIEKYAADYTGNYPGTQPGDQWLIDYDEPA